MSPKSAVKNDERGGGTLIGMSGNPPTFAHCTDGSRYPRRQMPPKFSCNLARVSGRIIKQARRRRLMRPSPPPSWAELPFDITANILHRLGAVKILETAQYVCKAWRSVCNDPSMWRVIDMPESSTVSNDSSKRPAIDKSKPRYCSIWPVTRKSRPKSRPKPSDADLEKMSRLENMCRYAVDKSQGQLVDINLEYFASDELLDYIAEKSENLTCLRLARCDQLSDDGLIEAVQEFPNLAKFHIILSSDTEYDGLFVNQYPPLISDETIEMIGESCPLLRSFALNIKRDYSRNDHRRRGSCDEAAYAIARSMPELRHLQLRGNGLTDEGLEAILDGCPHLESLDLHRSTNVKLVNGGLRKRCLSQIKCLRWKEYHFPNMPRPGRFVF